MLALNKFYNMNCMDALIQFPDNYFELAIVDPQYGINATKMKMGTNLHRDDGYKRRCSTAERIRNEEQSLGIKNTDWDSVPPPPEYFIELFRVSKNQIIWGGNYFDLPPTRCVICWDKLQPWDAFSQWEMAWTSFDKPAKMYRISNTGGGNNETKISLSQKPVELYIRCLADFAKPGDKLLDTHVGSASCLMACYKLGFSYIGFEKDAWTYQKASERLESLKAQQSLFVVS